MGTERKQSAYFTKRLRGAWNQVAVERACLKCDRKFASVGIQNRLCDNCRRSNEFLFYESPTRLDKRMSQKLGESD